MIRQALSSDITAISNVLYESFEKAYRGILSDDRLDSFLKTVKENDYIEEIFWDYKMLVFEEDGEITGYATYGFKENTILLYELYVRPLDQKKGIGKNLIEELKSMHTDKAYMDVEVVTKNQGAIHFYEKLGFDTILSYEHASEFHVDVYLMRKEL